AGAVEHAQARVAQRGARKVSEPVARRERRECHVCRYPELRERFARASADHDANHRPPTALCVLGVASDRALIAPPDPPHQILAHAQLMNGAECTRVYALGKKPGVKFAGELLVGDLARRKDLNIGDQLADRRTGPPGVAAQLALELDS